MSVFSWLGRSFGLKDAAPWGAFFGGSSTAGKVVTPDTTLQLSAAWACVRLVSSTWATLPLNLYERQEGGRRKVATDHPLYEVLRVSPNADQTPAEFWEGAAACILLRGRFYARKVMRRDGSIIALETMHPDATTATRENGNVVFRWRDPDGKMHTLQEREVFLLDGFNGLYPLKYARNSVGASLAADEVAAKTFGNGLQGSGFLQVEQELKEPQRDQLNKIMREFVGSKNAGKLMILEAGMKYQPLSFKPEEAQLLSTRAFHIEEICRWFGVPPVLIGHAASGQTMWGTGIEQIFLGWLMTQLRPLLVKGEQSISKRLLLPADRSKYYAEWSVEGLQRADSAGRAALWSSFSQNAIMTRNEIREKENLPPMPGGDVLTAQSNLVPLDMLGNSPDAAAAKSALRAFLGLEEGQPK